MKESKVAVYGALTVNIAIAATKFVVAALTGSSAMLSEAIHSSVDSINEVLMLVGLHRSQLPATPEHPFGNGKELYFWSLMVGVLVFGVGGGVSLYEGVLHVRNPGPLEDPFWNYVVLAAAAGFESISLAVGLRQFARQRGATPFWQALRTTKDPTIYTVIAEDSAALVGLALAALGVFLSHWLRIPVLDGTASILIGLLLCGVATLLISSARDLLVGEGLDVQSAKQVREIIGKDPAVQAVGQLLSMYTGADRVLLTVDVCFKPQTGTQEVAAAIDRIEAQVKSRYPQIRRIFIEAENGKPAAR
jgi:cation diffusion facilitator family transporter